MSLRTFSRLGLVSLSTFTAIACSSASGVPQTDSPTSATAAQTAPAAAPALHRAAFEPASVVVPAGKACALHPVGNLDPKQTVHVGVEADGVARFQAVRALHAGDVEQLALDCTDAQGHATTYDVDLRSDDTFAARPFDPIRAGYEPRPALSGDPLSYSPEELVTMGYGIPTRSRTPPATRAGSMRPRR